MLKQVIRVIVDTVEFDCELNIQPDMAGLDDLKSHLEALGLPTHKLPTNKDVRKAFKDSLIMHPDRAGAASTSAFQEVTEAARVLLDYLADLHTPGG